MIVSQYLFSQFSMSQGELQLACHFFFCSNETNALKLLSQTLLQFKMNLAQRRLKQKLSAYVKVDLV